MPLQGLLFNKAGRRITRAGNRELSGFPVGQIVGRMNQVRPTRDVIFDMVQEYIETVERMSASLADDASVS
jgi:NAD(P)H-dependent flavin oxidoreductase YrpB (nitropropane dioxygenase family)